MERSSLATGRVVVGVKEEECYTEVMAVTGIASYGMVTERSTGCWLRR